MESVEAMDRGFKHDRRFMVVDEEYNFITQREYPQMATVKCEIFQDSILMLSCGGSSILVSNWKEGPKRTARVWRSIVDNCIDQGDEVANWITKILQSRNCRLVYMDDDTHRAVNEAVAPGHEVSFADGYPYLIASTSSLDDLNKRIVNAGGEAVPMSRFRPSIVIEGLFPWTEDIDGAEVKFPASGHVLRILKPCDRCKVTTIDQASGVMERSGEPLKTLRAFRKIKHSVDVFFATNAILVQNGAQTKNITLGAAVEIDWYPKRN
jgi:uncharacterized protein YcbX